MKRLGFAVAVLAALVWSAVVWGGYVLLAGAGTFVAQNAGMFGLPVDLVVWAQFLFDNFGQGTAIVLWLLGLGLIGIVLLVFNAVTGRLSPAAPARSRDQAPPASYGEPARAPQPRSGASAWGRDASRR